MRCLLYIVILLTITACGVSASQQKVLDDAQKMMHSDPSAALSKLNTVDVSELKDSATMARWALLYSEAMVINQLSAPTDTIINIAVDYYGHHNLKDQFKKASRLKALIKSSGNRDELATALYLQKEKEFFLYKERTKRQMQLILALAVIFVAAIIIIWLHQRLRMQSLRNDSLMAEASSMKCQIQESRGDVGRLQQKLHGLLENRFALIDSLCQTYYESQGTKSERKAIVEKVKSEIDAVRTDSFPEMEQAVNDCRDNVLVKIKEGFPELKPEDYRLLVYLASGLSTRTICLLLDESVNVIYKRKSRLKSRLKAHPGVENSGIMALF